jgi:hypothetical protein
LGNIATSAAANTEALMAMADELRIELDQYLAQARMVKNVAFAVVRSWRIAADKVGTALAQERKERLSGAKPWSFHERRDAVHFER